MIRVEVRYVRASTAATIVRADEGPEMAKEDLHLLYLDCFLPTLARPPDPRHPLVVSRSLASSLCLSSV